MLPSPADTRALVVGIEDYSRLGSSFRVPGAASAAVRFAKWLVSGCGVDIGSIDLWLMPTEGVDPQHLCNDAGLNAVALHSFNWESFRTAVELPKGTFSQGSFLIVYFCGHGAVKGINSAHHLVLPEASKTQLRSIALDNWRVLFSSGQWARFGHQIWVVDACRNQWSVGLDPSSDEWRPGIIKPVRRCLLSSCAEGEVASMSLDSGPRFTGELLAKLADDPQKPWPDFEKAFGTVAASLRNTGNSYQSPTIQLESWEGQRQTDVGRGRQPLNSLLDQIPWDFKKFLPYIMRSQAMSPVGFAPPQSLEDGLELLAQLAPINDVEPIVEFAARIASACDNPELRRWVELSLSPRQAAELAQRLSNNSAFVRLSLWYRCDGDQHCIEGDLNIVDAGSGIRPWPRMPSKPVEFGHEVEVMGIWVQAVYEHLGMCDFDLEVELFLTSEMLPRATFDITSMPLPDGEVMTLGEAHGTVLRCADRYKGGRKLLALRSVAPCILARHPNSPDPLRWATKTEDPTQLINAFKTNDPAAPVWLGFSPDADGPVTLLNTAVSSGLPAAIWLRASPTLLTPEALQGKLRTLLANALETIPAKFAELRCKEQDAALKSVALLLDDPNRIPSIFTRYRQPGE